MKGPHDAIGNELREGMHVRVELDKPCLIGQVVKIENGGIIAPGQANMEVPARAIITCHLQVVCSPGGSVPNVFALKEPKKDEDKVALN